MLTKPQVLISQIDLILAKKIICEIEDRYMKSSSALNNLLSLNESYLNKIDFKPYQQLSCLITDSLTEDLKEACFNIVLLSRASDSVNLAASNAITFLNKSGFSFANKDISKISIPYADLSYGVFIGTNFESSNLYGVNFSMTQIYDSNFRNCNMTETDFGEKLSMARLKEVPELFSFSACGKYFAIAINAKIFLYDSETYHVIARLVGHTKQVKFLVFSDNGSYLASASSNLELILWSTASRQKLAAFTAYNSFANFSPCSNYLCLLISKPNSNTNILSIYNIKSRQIESYGSTTSKYALFAPTVNNLINLFVDSCWIFKWDLLEKKIVNRIECDRLQASFAISSSRKHLAVSYNYYILCVYDTEKLELIWKNNVIFGSTYLKFSPCGRYLALRADFQRIDIFNLSTKDKYTEIFDMKDFPAKSLEFSPNGKSLVLRTLGKQLKFRKIPPYAEKFSKLIT